MDETYDRDLLTVAWWAVTFQEVRIKRRGRIWDEEYTVVGGGAGVGPSGEGVTAVMGEAGSNQAVVVIGDRSNGVEAAEVGGGPEAMVDASGAEAALGSGGGSLGSGDGGEGRGGDATGTPSTPTVEELLAAAERAGNERRAGDSNEVMVGGRVVATSVLRTTALESRGGDSGIGASRPVPFEAGDFLDSAGPRDVMDAFRLEPEVEAVLRGARTLEDRTSALLLGALLSGAGASDTGGLG
ncbi:hypothetical protein RHMOL_Rhmol01G0110400 [Rhododendron molle]|uniref:Uncharacterized protein n=1 Tax=Rhododendron molle TaxID=49168 RepID=A0ACC0Q1Q5_RHOML|nr:hypothetical protein RHMOL_Rhmol01G0110400 [Rhododendron molle]